MNDELRDALRKFYEATCIKSVPIPGESLVGWKPLRSEAMAVHPKQIKEAEESAKRKGVPTEFDTMGRPEFVSREHRKRYMRAYGFHDNDGGYGDG
jgi:hypothetical protein